MPFFSCRRGVHQCPLPYRPRAAAATIAPTATPTVPAHPIPTCTVVLDLTSTEHSYGRCMHPHLHLPVHWPAPPPPPQRPHVAQPQTATSYLDMTRSRQAPVPALHPSPCTRTCLFSTTTCPVPHGTLCRHSGPLMPIQHPPRAEEAPPASRQHNCHRTAALQQWALCIAS